MEGDIITARELFTFQYRGEGNDSRIDGEFLPTRMRPDFLARVARYGFSSELLEALNIRGP
jgi:pilus assembly protein CpaF